MMRLLFRLSAFAAAGVALTSLGGLFACNSNNACEGVSCIPNVTVTLDHPISDPGSYEVDFVADGKKMSCTVSVPSTKPASCTDSAAFVAQESGKGITFLSVDGTYDTLSVTVKRDGEAVVSHTYSSLKYVSGDFTGAGCASCPIATVTLTTGREPSDASVPSGPDASLGGGARDGSTASSTDGAGVPSDATAP